MSDAKCGVCGKKGEHPIASVPGVPHSAAYCKECFASNAHPYDLVVINTWSCGGYDECVDWWKNMVNDTLKHLKIPREEFDKDVFALDDNDRIPS
jgi:hypothetical protein